MYFFKRLEQALKSLREGQILLAEDRIYPIENKMYKMFCIAPTVEDIPTDKVYNLYEIIDGKQRLYMDIDVYNDHISEDALEHFISHIKGIYDTEVYVYTSHREDKESYHLVLSNIFVYDNIQAKIRISELIQSYNDPYDIVKFVDMRIYRKHQQFRLLGSSKINTNNVKKPWKNTPNSLQLSLISYRHNPSEDKILKYSDDLTLYNGNVPIEKCIRERKKKRLTAKYQTIYYSSDEEESTEAD